MQNIKRSPLLSLLIAFVLVVSACNLPTKNPGQDAASTAAAQTVQAQLTQSSSLLPTVTSTFPVVTTVAPPTLQPTATRAFASATASCDIAEFVTDVTVPDGTVINAGQAFTKTWRFKNAGTCSWTTGYSVIFSSGNAMGGPNVQALPGNVNPGQSVDISVNLTAPATPGDYTGYWKLRNASGVLFAHFYVQIKVQSAVTNTPPVAQVTLNAVPGESGTVYEAAAGQSTASTILAGDTGSNFIARGFMSFDISSLAGKTVSSATLDLTTCSQVQNPFTSLAGIWVGELQYALPLDQSDYDTSGTGIQNLSAVPNSPIDVKAFVQSRVNEGKARFQIRLHPAGATDGDAQADYISCNAGNVTLKIGYQP